jgi:serine/threonine protein kinase
MRDSPPFRPGTAWEIIDRVCDEFESGWLAGQPAALEDLVRSAPEPFREELFRELLPLEREYRARDGRPMPESEARERFATLGPWAESIYREQLGSTIDWRSQASETPSEFPIPAAHTPSRSADLPEFIGGYRVIRELGRGGMGVVYLVDDQLGRRQLAVKVMRPERAADPVARSRFLREARAASAVEHDHVVPVYQVGENDGTPFLAMPLLKGESLEDRLVREPLPPLSLVFKVGREVALGLSAAHEKGLVHRDAKPGNTWLEGDPSAPDLAEQVRRVKVLDFGLACAADGTDKTSMTGSIIGTPAYMAPEQARGESVDERADLFSLGAILYRMATGRQAFAGPTTTAVLTAIATHNPPPAHEVNPAVPAALSILIEHLLSKDPNGRPRSARETAETLTAIENGAPTPLAKPARRYRWGAAAAVLLALCVAGATVRALLSRPRMENDRTASLENKDSAPQTVTSSGAAPSENGSSPNTKGSPATGSTAVQGSEPSRTRPFRIERLDLQHYARTPQGDEPRGVLGIDSFAPRLGDRVQMIARLSRPGYAYIIAFRPDGVAELCFPETDDVAPPLTDTPRYPEAGSTNAFGLDNGTGLYLFAVVASERPLPSYQEWLAKRTLGWKPATGSGATAEGSVLRYDGADLETLTAGGVTRSKGAELTGPAAKVLSLARALGKERAAEICVIGITVRKPN